MVCVQGRGWQPGHVKALLSDLIAKYEHIPKVKPYVYQGDDIGPDAAKVFNAWRAMKHQPAPTNWSPPPPAGYIGAQGMELVG